MELNLTSSSLDNPSSTREEKIKQYIEKDIQGGKSSLCRFYLRGLCLFPAQECKFAHGLEDLQFKILPYEDTNNAPKKEKKANNKKPDENEEDVEEENESTIKKQPSLFLGINYKDLYEYQLILKDQGRLNQIYTQEEVNKNGKIRREIRGLFHPDLQQRFLNQLYVIYKTKALRKDFIEKCFQSIDWRAHWKYLLADYAYETRQGKIVKQFQGEKFDEFMEDCVVKIIKDQDFVKQLPISSSMIMKHYYSHLGSIDPLLPPHHIYLKQKEVKTMDQYLNSVQYTERFRLKLAKVCGMTPQEMSEVVVFEHLGNEFQELTEEIRLVLLKVIQESDTGFVPYSVFENTVTDQCSRRLQLFNNSMPQIRKLMLKLVLQENILLLTINAITYLLCPVRFKECTLSEVDEKIYQRLYDKCYPIATDHITLHEAPDLRSECLNFTMIEKQTEEFLEQEIDLNKVVLVDTIDALNIAMECLKNVDQISIDLEGSLRKNGRLELIQCGTKDKIFIFDVYKVKKMAKDSTKVEFYQKMANFLKCLMEDSTVCKVFHDGRKDSLALHFFLDACPSNVFDLSAVYVLIEQLEQYMAQRIKMSDKIIKKEIEANIKNNTEEAKINMKEEIQQMLSKNSEGIYTLLGDIKLPSLNEVLGKYQASHGINGLKYVMRKRFWQLPAEYFLIRPIDKEFLIYSAKDVEDLVEVKEKMERRLHEILASFIGEVDPGKAKLICKEASKAYGSYGCKAYSQGNDSNEQEDLSD